MSSSSPTRLPWVPLMCSILQTSVLVLEDFQSMSSGGRSGMQRALALPSKVSPVPSHLLPLLFSLCSSTDPDSGSDFKLDAFLAAPCETFDPHYGVGGYNGDGDITRPDNQSEFRNYVMKHTEGKGVHFAMADGVSRSLPPFLFRVSTYLLESTM